MQPKYNWIPPHMIERYYLAIHSPKSIPEFDYGNNFIEIKINRVSTVTFNKINIENVEDENICHDYDDDEFSRSDCIAICVMKKVQHELGRFNAILNKFLFRKEYSKLLPAYNQTRYISPDRFDAYTEFKSECMQQCKQDCSFAYFLYDINIGREIESNDYHRESLFYINSKQIPDIYIKHIPETTFISFISNFGGLLGMWLGISVIMIFENIFNLFKQIIGKFSEPKPGNLFIQIIQNQNINFN